LQEDDKTNGTRVFSTKRKVAFYLIGFSLTITVAFLFSEIVLRIAYRNLPSDFLGWDLFCRNEEFDYRRMKANVTGYAWAGDYGKTKIVSNSRGYRDSEWDSKKGERIMFLGDSFGWGWGCPSDSMISSQLEKNINVYTSVFNLCIPGDDLHRIYCRFRYHENEIEPKRIIILNYVNDFFEVGRQDSLIAYKEEIGLFKEQLGDLPCSKYYDSTLKDIWNKSYLIRLFQRYRFISNSWNSDNNDEDLLREGFKEDVEFFESEEKVEYAMNMYIDLLRQISTKYPVTVVYIPPQYHVDNTKAIEISNAFNGATIDVDWMSSNLKLISTELPNIQVIDLTSFLRLENKKRQVYFSNDAHLNPYGQSIVGIYLSNLITYNLSSE